MAGETFTPYPYGFDLNDLALHYERRHDTFEEGEFHSATSAAIKEAEESSIVFEILPPISRQAEEPWEQAGNGSATMRTSGTL